MNEPFYHIKQNRYVAYFDMLGFKTATERNPAKAYESLKALRGCMDEVSKLNIRIVDQNVVLSNRIKIFILADSVLIFTAEDSEYDLVVILTLTSTLFAKSLSRCVPLRGAISHGEFFYNLELNIFGGLPFVRAYDLERKAQWSGIVVDDNVSDHYKKLNSLKCPDGSSVIISWEVPLKDTTKERLWVVDWVKPHKKNFKINPPISVMDYYSGFVKLFGPYDKLKPEIQEKYKNTVEFINYSLSK